MKNTMRALTFSRFGGPEVLEVKKVSIPSLEPGQVLVANKAIGLNYADIYRRKGNYHLKGNPPYIAGYEGAGEVVASRSDLFRIGDRVGYADVPFSNAEFTLAGEDHLIPLPDDISFETAAAVLLQGLTAQYLVNDSHSVNPGEWVVVHAAAGGVGKLLCRLAKHKGAGVIGLSRTEHKLGKIFDAGADHALLLNDQWVNEVWQITGGRGADVVYDSVGSTLQDSFLSAREGGQVVFYGMSGGDPAPVDPRMLMDTSKTLTGGDLWGYLKTREDRISRSAGLFRQLTEGVLKTPEPMLFPLEKGGEAHACLESGKFSEKILLIP